jgi:predicted GNAT family acetyltransferase
MVPPATVVHDPDGHRYRLLTGDAKMGELTYRELEPGVVAFLHTEVAPELQGGGLGSLLVERALADAHDRGLQVVPVCPFVAAYLRRHTR